MPPKVSVLIPVYNTDTFIGDAIRSVLNQTFKDFELIVVDNKSTDNTLKIAQEFSQDSRVKVFQNSENIGMTRNWNQCLLYSQGEYIKFLCADDYLEEFALAEFVKAMEENPESILSFCPKRVLNVNGEIVSHAPLVTGEIKGESLFQMVLSKHINPVGEPTFVMFRRAALNIGLFNNDFNWITDIDYWFRLGLNGKVFGLSHHCAAIRKHAGQTTNQLQRANKTLKEEKSFLIYNFFVRESDYKFNYQQYVSASRRHIRNLIFFKRVSLKSAILYFSDFAFPHSLLSMINIAFYFTAKRIQEKFKK